MQFRNNGNAHPTYRPELDALRGGAALIVVVSHAANAGLLPGFLGFGFGQMGVGLFYCLSAFLLTTLYSRKDQDKAAVQDYCIRRITRVLPLFYTVLIGSVLIEAATGFSAYGALSSGIALVQNIALAKGTSVLWSIPVEIHFYAAFLLFWAYRAINIYAAIGALIAIQIGLLLIAQAMGFSHLTLPYWMHFFTFGCLLASIVQNDALRRCAERSKLLRGLSLAALLATPLILPEVRRQLDMQVGPNFMDPLTLTWVALVSVAFVFRFAPKPLFQGAIPRFLGQVSFSVYLIHIVVINLVLSALPNDIAFPGSRLILMLCLSYGLAALTTHFFERRAQKLLLSKLPSLRNLVGSAKAKTF